MTKKNGIKEIKKLPFLAILTSFLAAALSFYSLIRRFCKNKEKTGSQDHANAYRWDLLPSQTSIIKQYLFKYLSVNCGSEKCKGRVAQWIEPLSDSGEDASSNTIRKSRRAHTDFICIDKIEKEENQAHSLNKESLRLRGISHKFALDSEIAESHTLDDIENSYYKNVSVLNPLRVVSVFILILFSLFLPFAFAATTYINPAAGYSLSINNTILITNDGLVGIGTTSPGTQMDINGASRAVTTSWNDTGATGATLTLRESSSGSNANKGGAILFGAGQGNFAFIQGGITASVGPTGILNFGTRTSTGNITTRMTINEDGNVGINTTSPTVPLHISMGGGTSTGLMISQSNGDLIAGINLSRPGSGWRIANDGGISNGPLTFGESGNAQGTRMVILSGGNVGIGTTTPSETLSVNGNVSIESAGNCRDTGGSATCNNFVDFAELFDSSEPVDSGDVVIIDFKQVASQNPLSTQEAQATSQNPKITSNSFQNAVDNTFQNSVGTQLQNSVGSKFQNSVDNGFKVKKSRQPYDSKVIGIVSTQPAIVIEGGRIVAMGNWKGQNNTLKPAVALAGRVPVKVTDENGPIQKGDLLTTSGKPGYAMKFSLLDPSNAEDLNTLKLTVKENENRRNAVLGKSLENCEQKECTILAFVSLQ